MPVIISGTTLDIAPGGSPTGLYVLSGTLAPKNSIGQRSTCDFTVVDAAGAQHYEQGNPVVVTDDSSGAVVFAGQVVSDTETQPGQSALLEHALALADWHVLADKRRFPYSNANVSAGSILSDMLSQVLGQEGVYAIKNLLSANQSDVETDTTGFSASTGTGFTVTRDTTKSWHGTASLKAVSPGTVGQFDQVVVAAPQASFTAGAPYVASFYIRGSGQLFICWAQGNGTQYSPSYRFGSSNPLTDTAWTRVSIAFTAPNPIPATGLGLKFITETGGVAYTAWIDGLQIEPDPLNLGSPAYPTPWELGGTSTIQAGPVIVEFTSNYATCAECLDALAQAAGTFVWQIDATKRLWFGAQGQQIAPWGTATAADMERDSIQVERANPLYRNRQFLLGGTDVTSTQTEQRKGDGSATAFTFSYPLAQVPAVTVNGTSKTVGIKGVDTGKDWYWAKGDAVLAQDSAGVKLVSTDTLQVVYVGQFPIVIQSDDSSEQTAEQSREGGLGTGTGIVEDVQTDSTLSSSAAGFQVAAGYLARYSQLGKQLTFTTRRSGLAQGQLLTVDLTGTSHDIGPGEQMLIESVSAQHDGLQWWYTVKALEGPINTTWVQFFTALAGKAAATVDKINLGASGTLVILASATAAVSLAVTGKVTITTYALPSPTSYPSPTTYPGSTGAPVALTWTKTNAGCNFLRGALSGAYADGIVRYLAWGTGTQGTPSTATQLAAEAGRKPITKFTLTGNVGEVIIDGLIGPTDGPGTAITEVALFAGPAAGAGANTGVMLLYGLYSHTHTNTENLDIQADITFS